MHIGQDLPAWKSDDRVVITEVCEQQWKERKWVGSDYLWFLAMQKIGEINWSYQQLKNTQKEVSFYRE